VYVIENLQLTSYTKFALADAGGLPDPNIVASNPITCPSRSGGTALADAHRRRSPIQPHEVVCR